MPSPTKAVRRLALVAVLLLTACTNQADLPTPTPTPTVVPLTVAQATQAALRVSDLPKGWDGGVAVDPRPTPGPRGQYDPAECVAFRHPTDPLGKPTTAVRGQYFTRQPLQTVTEFVWSWPTEPDSLVPDLVSGLGKCSSYTMVAPDEEKYRWAATRLPVSGLSNGLALRYDASTESGEPAAFVIYSAYVVRGGTVVYLEVQGETITDAVFAQLVSKAVARLDAVG
ncbi:hypothetical protein [Kribbella sp. HUAS MG21]|uniref:Sensor domain-containing protein n=1 Tax=Kribbella sp. HUAS MG21 TaxID=3160966 RepID=A0AAU7T525_9ACTN